MALKATSYYSTVARTVILRLLSVGVLVFSINSQLRECENSEDTPKECGNCKDTTSVSLPVLLVLDYKVRDNTKTALQQNCSLFPYWLSVLAS